MGRLKPGATYIYEHVNGITYAREPGAPINTRFEVGRTFQRTQLDEQLEHELTWKDIFREAEHNPALQEAIERVKILYYLTKNNDNGNSET